MVTSPEGWFGDGADVGLDLLLQAAPCGDRRLCEAGKAREFFRDVVCLGSGNRFL